MNRNCVLSNTHSRGLDALPYSLHALLVIDIDIDIEDLFYVEYTYNK